MCCKLGSFELPCTPRVLVMVPCNLNRSFYIVNTVGKKKEKEKEKEWEQKNLPDITRIHFADPSDGSVRRKISSSSCNRESSTVTLRGVRERLFFSFPFFISYMCRTTAALHLVVRHLSRSTGWFARRFQVSLSFSLSYNDFLVSLNWIPFQLSAW